MTAHRHSLVDGTHHVLLQSFPDANAFREKAAMELAKRLWRVGRQPLHLGRHQRFTHDLETMTNRGKVVRIMRALAVRRYTKLPASFPTTISGVTKLLHIYLKRFKPPCSTKVKSCKNGQTFFLVVVNCRGKLFMLRNGPEGMVLYNTSGQWWIADRVTSAYQYHAPGVCIIQAQSHQTHQSSGYS